jgi:PilZ domain
MPIGNLLFDYWRTLPGRTCTGNVGLGGQARFPQQTREMGHPKDFPLRSEFNTSPEDGVLAGKLIHLALPVRWSLVGQSRGPVEMACTYDIHPRGARLLSWRGSNTGLTIGDLIMIERGRSKSLCQVVWTADPESALRGQFTVRCVDGAKSPWDEELRQMEEQYQPMILDAPQRGSHNGARGFGQPNATRPEANRRRGPRFHVEGQAEVIGSAQRVEGEVRQISEFGARITASDVMNPGTDFRLMLNVFDVSVALKARVKYLVENLGMGVEFQEIRRGDRPLLSYVLSKLRTRKVEESLPVEVANEPLAVAG